MLMTILNEYKPFLDCKETGEYLKIISKEFIGKGERHHVLPASIYPQYRKSSWNIINLTHKDHYRCHELLPFMLTGKEKSAMVFAWNMISKRNGETIDSEKYTTLKMEYSKLVTERLLRDNPMKRPEVIAKFKGVKKPETSLRLIGDNNPSKMPHVKKIKSQKLKNYWADPKTRESRSGKNHPNYGKSLSEEAKRKIGLANSRPSPLKGRERPTLKGKLAGNKNPMAKSVVINGVVYETLTQAAKEYNVTVQAIGYWIKTGKAVDPRNSKKVEWTDGRTKSVVIGGTIFETINSAAEYYEVSRTTIINWVKKGKAKFNK